MPAGPVNLSVMDGGGTLRTVQYWSSDGTVTGVLSLMPVSASGAAPATETTLAAVNTKLGAPLAVTGPATDAQLRATALPVSAAALPLPAGAATETTLAAVNTKLGAALAVTGPATDAQLRATALPVSGPLTDAQLRASAVPTAPAAGENHIGKVGGESAVVTGTFNRPADTNVYASGDLVANSVTAGSVTPIALAAARVNAGTGSIVRCRLTTSKTGLAGTDVFRVHLFKNQPTTITNGDNGAFSVSGVQAVHLGHFDITLDKIFSDGAKGSAAPAIGSQIVFDAAGGSQNLYALIEARGAYPPASGETFTVALEVLRD